MKMMRSLLLLLLLWIPWLMLLNCHWDIHPSLHSNNHPTATVAFAAATDDDDATDDAVDEREQHVIGIDFGTESVRVGIFSCINGQLKASSAIEYKTYFPSPGHAEQDPLEWWTSVCKATKATMADTSKDVYESIAGLCIDTTACTVVALDKDYK